MSFDLECYNYTNNGNEKKVKVTIHQAIGKTTLLFTVMSKPTITSPPVNVTVTRSGLYLSLYCVEWMVTQITTGWDGFIEMLLF